MKKPGNKWKPGKEAGTWFRHVAVIGPCVAKNGNVTALKQRITVPFEEGWAMKVAEQMPLEKVRVVATINNKNSVGIAMIPLAAIRNVVMKHDKCLHGEYIVSPGFPHDKVSMKMVGLHSNDGIGGKIESVILEKA